MKQETLKAIKENTETLYNHYKKGEISKEEILELRQEAIDDEEYEVAVSIKKVLDTINLEERVDWIALIHKQNLNGRETEDELFEAGILAGIEETKEIMFSEEEVLNFTQTIIMQYKFGNTNIEQLDLLKETLQLFKNK
jgi:hypothetical protein